MQKIAFPHLDLLMSFEKDDQFRDLNKKNWATYINYKEKQFKGWIQP